MSNNLKPVSRDPLRFDLLNLLDYHGSKERLSINDGKAIDAFMGDARKSIQCSIDNPALLFGLRAEEMFSAMVLSFGSVQLIKREDSGELHSVDNIKIPDFRLVLIDGTHFLVEVKNFDQNGRIDKPYSFKIDYFNSLTKYAEVMGCKLMIAIFWANPKLWTLVPASAFKIVGKKYELSIFDAMSQNEMSVIGDKLIGTTPPLRMIFYGEQLSSQVDGDTESADMRITDRKILCADRVVSDPTERSIAFYLMLYGKWNEETRYTNDGGQIVIEHIFTPEEETGQGFEFVGPLSQMFSMFYLYATSSGDGIIERLRIPITPGALGKLIPKNYKGKALPVWSFVLKPTLPPGTEVDRG